MLHEEPICLFISRKLQCEVFAKAAFSKKARELHRQHQQHWCENLKERVYVPNTLYHVVFTTCCQTYEGDWSHSVLLLRQLF